MPRSSSKSLPADTEALSPAAWAKMNRIAFHDERLLITALTHRSYANEAYEPAAPDNERLEFLGDAVIGFVAADVVFRHLPGAPEGDLTLLRQALVRRETLAEWAREMQLGRALRMSAGERRNGGPNRTNMIADAFEALIGALYLDQGLDAVRQFVLPRLMARITQTLEEQSQVDARSRFHYRIEAEHGSAPTYRVVLETGPEHAREYTIEVLVKGGVWGIGSGPSKQAASQAAAAMALARLDTPVDGS